MEKSIGDFDRKIDPRFSFRNRIAILKLQSRSRSRSKTIPEKSLTDFRFTTGSRFFRLNQSTNIFSMAKTGSTPTSRPVHTSHGPVGSGEDQHDGSATIRSRIRPTTISPAHDRQGIRAGSTVDPRGKIVYSFTNNEYL